MDDEILIAVLGVTGAGKTTFISKATGRTDLKIGHGLQSCRFGYYVQINQITRLTSYVKGTQDMALAPTMINGKKVILIDTPGFDDSERTDTEILTLLAEHLHVTYQAGRLINGIILLQPINANRVQGSERKRTRLFEQICGPGAFGNVVIASTFWGELSDRSQGADREKEREQSKDFWGNMVQKGAKVARHENTAESAEQIVSLLVEKPTVTLQLQAELAQNGGKLAKTSAGQQLDRDLSAMCQKLMEELAEGREERKQMTADFLKEIQSLQSKIDKIEMDREVLEEKQVRQRFPTIVTVNEQAAPEPDVEDACDDVLWACVFCLLGPFTLCLSCCS